MLIESQQEALTKILTLVSQGHKRIVLQGSAGTGKTYLVNSLITALKKRLYTYGATWLTAPTHKALEVLRSKIEAKPYMEFATLHSALCLERKFHKNGEAYFAPKLGSKPLKNATVCIIDEASMVGSELVSILDEDCTDKLIIFVGDNKQLNPVKEFNSPIFNQGYPVVELTEIVRQTGGNPIIDLSNNLHWLNYHKDNYKLQMLPWEDEETPKGYLFTENRNRIVEKLAEVNGSDSVKYLAYINTDVNQMNFDVRAKIYGNPSKVEEGESLIFTAPFASYHNNQEIKVELVETREFEISIPSSGIVENGLSLQAYFINEEIPILHESSEAIFAKAVAQSKANAINRKITWPEHYKFAESFASITYNHAITVHKSQGSTYKEAIMNLTNIMYNGNPEERNRMLYTAITRASDLVIIYK